MTIHFSGAPLIGYCEALDAPDYLGGKQCSNPAELHFVSPCSEAWLCGEHAIDTLAPAVVMWQCGYTFFFVEGADQIEELNEWEYPDDWYDRLVDRIFLTSGE